MDLPVFGAPQVGGFCELHPNLHRNPICGVDEPSTVERAIPRIPWKPPRDVGAVVEWQPSGFSMCAAAQLRGINACWAEPRHSRMARLLTEAGTVEFNCVSIALIGGGFAKDLRDARQFGEVYQSLNCRHGSLITPRLINLVEMEFAPFSTFSRLDSPIYGDLMVGRWDICAFGLFNLQFSWILWATHTLIPWPGNMRPSD